MTQAEYRKKLSCIPKVDRAEKNPTLFSDGNLTDVINWVTKGAITPVKDQE